MDKSLLYATHKALHEMLISVSVYNLYAYVPGNALPQHDTKWKIKSVMVSNRLSYANLRYYDQVKEKYFPIAFKFGLLNRHHISGTNINGVNLALDHELERKVVEKMCQLSDDGNYIVAGDIVIMDKFKGSEFLMGIDLDAPSYSYLDELLI